MPKFALDVAYLLKRGSFRIAQNRRIRISWDLMGRLGIFCIIPITIIVLPVLRLVLPRLPIPKIIFHSLSSGQVFRRGSSDDFEEFIADERFGFNFRPSEVLIELKEFKERKCTNFRITGNCSIYLVLRSLTWAEFIQYIFHFLDFSIHALFHNRLHSHAPKKLIQMQLEFPLWKSSCRLDEIIFVTTQSTMFSLPTCFYVNGVKFEKFMLWYSANNRPVLKKGEPEQPYPNAHELRNFVDTHLVWSENERNWLMSMEIDNVKVLGSMTFTRPLRNQSEEKMFDIVYFDITAIPRNDIFMSEEMLTENLMGYVDVLESLREIDSFQFKGFLKPKRVHTEIHSLDYVNLRDELAHSAKIELLDFDVDLYEVIAKSRLVLAVPFTSPAFIAQELSVPVAFFCFSTRDYELALEMGNIPVLTNRDELRQFILRTIKC